MVRYTSAVLFLLGHPIAHKWTQQAMYGPIVHVPHIQNSM